MATEQKEDAGADQTEICRTAIKQEASSTVFEAKWLRMKQVTYRHGNEQRSWDMVERTTKHCDVDGVDVFAIVRYVDKPAHAIFILNYRPPVDQYVLEFPAGLIDPHETLEEAALRELKEETGYIGQISKAAVSPILRVDPWKSNESGRIVMVDVDGDDERNVNPVQSLEADEDIQVVLLRLDTLKEDIDRLVQDGNGRFGVDMKIYCFALGMQLSTFLPTN
eukprot:GILJ01003105.1.p1 GENE.GILJ01003105.1~~GILJ01003105.1.p1  ORF type:complete len:232 (-),score=39.30 GILJ01003105.1:41-706(-)